MERLYLIYQIFETEQFLRANRLCRRCEQWSRFEELTRAIEGVAARKSG
jgi:hypothetical protein